MDFYIDTKKITDEELTKVSKIILDNLLDGSIEDVSLEKYGDGGKAVVRFAGAVNPVVRVERALTEAVNPKVGRISYNKIRG